MKGVTQEVIADVRSRANILEVVAEHVVLKRTGKEHKGRCPFHDEKTPSFHVNPDKGIYKCFGCGEGGDVFAFIQKYRGIDFIDSVRELAHKYGVQLVESVEEKQQYDRRTAILLLYQQASEFYARMLKDPNQGIVAREYLAKRGVTDEIIERFKLGYAPNNWDSLLNYLTTAAHASPVTLAEAGLVRKHPERNSHYDLFRHRLMIPIFDEQGRVIAFGGRTLGDDQVKYLNSPETPIYTKGQHLFALNLAKESIKARDAVIVVEGYFDAITPHQYGFTNTVATLGTALTEAQAKSLVRFTESKRVFLAFDADAAGAKAVERGSETLNTIAEGIGIDLRVIRIPGGKDPDECLRTQAQDGVEAGSESFARALEQAPALIDYQLEQAMAAGKTEGHLGKIESAKRLVPILAQMKNAVARGEYIRQWALKLGIREEELLSDVGQFRRDNGLGPRAQSQWQRKPSQSQARGSLRSGYYEAEQRIIALYLTSRDDYDLVQRAMADEELITPAHQRVKEALDGIGSLFDTVQDLQYKLMDRLAPDKEAATALIEVILKVEEVRKQNAPIHVLLLQLRVRLLQERASRALAKLRTMLSSAQDDSEQAQLQSKIFELQGLDRNLTVISPDSDPSEFETLRRKILTAVA
ncbi:MAG TPA: DNA primase [Planktothrix sp.]|jgi:DNA primase